MLIKVAASPAGGALHALASPTPQGWEPKGYFWITNDAEIITEKVRCDFEFRQCT